MSNNQLEKILVSIIKVCVYLSVLSPLILSAAFFFPAIFPKMVFIRLLVEVALMAYLPLVWFAPQYRPKYHLVFLTLAVFAAVVVLTSALGVNFNYSFWGNYERTDGIFSWLHFWLLIIIAGSVFKTKLEWQKLFSASIVAAILVSGYGFLQRWGVSNFGSLRIYDTGAGRITGTIGNPGFLAVYLLFNLLFALNLVTDRLCSRSRRVFGGASILVLAPAFLMTGMRGAFLGLMIGLVFFAAGYLFWVPRSRVRLWVVSALAIFFILVGILFIFRNSEAVKGNGFIGRYFNASLSDPTIQTRLISWQGALAGARDNLWLGAGPQKFDVIFNRYFDPRFYSLVGTETWWDRAHNMALEVLVTMGIIGLLSYLAVGLAVLYSLWQLGRREAEVRVEVLIWISFFIAYFIQNLFIFDSTTSYLMLSLALAYVAARSLNDRTVFSFLKIKPHQARGLNFFIFVLLVFFGIGLAGYQTNLKIIKHNRLLLSNLAKERSQPLAITLANYRRLFDLSDFDQREAAIKLGQFMGQYPFTHEMTADELKSSFNFTLKQMERAIKKNPGDVRLLLSYGNTVNVYGELLKNSSSKEALAVLAKAEKALLEAVSLGSSRQQVFYSLANTYLIGGNKEKGVEVLENAVRIYEETPTTYWLLSFAYLQAGDKDKAQAAADQALDRHYFFNDEKEGNYIASLYLERKDYDRLLRLYKQVAEQTQSGTSQARLAALYAQLGRKDEAIAAAEEVTRRDSSLKDQVFEFIKEVKSDVKRNYLLE